MPMENNTGKMFENTEILNKPSLHYGVDPTTIEGRDKGYHYAFLIKDQHGMIPHGYKVVNSNETGEKPVNRTHVHVNEKGELRFEDTVLCRIPKEEMKKKEAERVWRQNQRYKSLGKQFSRKVNSSEYGKFSEVTEEKIVITKGG
mgnify:CR=1 FL=1